MRKLVSLGMISVMTIAGCAKNSAQIQSSYVSPMQYKSYSCAQLAEEGQRVSARASQAIGVQDKKASGDAVAMGVGLVLFWPALFFVQGDSGTSAEVARLKGEMEALEQESIRKRCGIQFRPPEPAVVEQPPKTSAPEPTKF
jgi:hypothetical protein